jgi:D-galactarolactone isomerase
MLARRTFIQGAAALATTTGLSIGRGESQQVPNSSGTELPKVKAPPGACDCHMHIFDPRFAPLDPSRPTTANATVADYRLLQKRLGLTRNIVVSPRNSGNDVTVDALKQLAPNARGVAVVPMTISDAELKRLNDAGIRGHRFDLADPLNNSITPEVIETFAKRAADLGWHLQFFANGDKLVQIADVLRRLPTQIVLDHMGQPPLPAGTDHPGHRIVLELLEKGKGWTKISNIPSNSKIGAPAYPEATKTAQALIKAVPERLVWGTDWPHPGERDHKPNDATLFDLWAEWAPNEATRTRILVDNPAQLYGFPKTA